MSKDDPDGTPSVGAGASWAWVHDRPASGSEFDVPGVVDTRTPNIARVYDYWLGGKDHFAADRALGDRVREAVPGIADGVRANRAFLARAVTELARAGVDQFLDLGAGIPTSPNVHEIAQAVDPRTRVLYVDHDPVVLANARALLAVDRTIRVVAGDLRDPVSVLGDEVVLEHLDWDRPVAVLLVAVLHFLADPEAAALLDAVAAALRGAGGVIVVSHVTPVDRADTARAERMDEAVALYNAQAGRFVPRTRAQLDALLAGWQLLPPGLVRVTDWRPGGGTAPEGSAPDRAVRPVPVLAAVATPTPPDGGPR